VLKLNKNILPEFSIIICNFNHAKWIERCLRSIAHQENIDNNQYEIILVDDKSSDNSLEIIKNINSKLDIRIIKNKKNLGLPASLNKAIQTSLGRYIVRVDSDDYIARNFLYLSRLFLNYNHEYQAVAADYVKVDAKEKSLSKHNSIKQQIACGVTFRKECLFDIGLYDESFKMREGHDLRMRFEKKYKIGRLEFPLYKYRTHDTNRTHNKKKLKIYDKKLNEK
jgi:glycosyltransferase involved in cell wall biosynthesis